MLDKKDAGRRVRLIYASTRTDLKSGDTGTYEFALRGMSYTHHCIKWDNGSRTTLTEGMDEFEFTS